MNFRQETTTSPLGVIIGTFSHTIPLSTSITSPKAGKKGCPNESKVRKYVGEQYHRISCGYVAVDGIIHGRNYGQLKKEIPIEHFSSFSESCWVVTAVALTLVAQEAHLTARGHIGSLSFVIRPAEF